MTHLLVHAMCCAVFAAAVVGASLAPMAASPMLAATCFGMLEPSNCCDITCMLQVVATITDEQPERLWLYLRGWSWYLSYSYAGRVAAVKQLHASRPEDVAYLHSGCVLSSYARMEGRGCGCLKQGPRGILVAHIAQCRWAYPRGHEVCTELLLHAFMQTSGRP